MNYDILHVKLQDQYTVHQTKSTDSKEPVDVWSAAGVSHSLPVVRILNTFHIVQYAVMFTWNCVFLIKMIDWLIKVIARAELRILKALSPPNL